MELLVALLIAVPIALIGTGLLVRLATPRVQRAKRVDYYGKGIGYPR